MRLGNLSRRRCFQGSAGHPKAPRFIQAEFKNKNNIWHNIAAITRAVEIGRARWVNLNGPKKLCGPGHKNRSKKRF